MSSINSLLNHEPTPGQHHHHPPQPHHQHHQHHHHYAAQTTTYEAADALTTLATLGSGQQYAPSPTAHSHAPRRRSSIGSHHAPIEPSPSAQQPQVHSPTLEQYHHGSASPEEQKRRQSLMARTSPAPVLAPIQNLSGALNEKLHEDAQPRQQEGEDVSQTLSPPNRGSDENASSPQDSTQHREPGFVRYEPTTTQIREPEAATSPAPPPVPVTSHLQENEAPSASPNSTSPQPFIKHEPSGTPRAPSPSATSTATIAAAQPPRRTSVTTDNMDPDTLKAIEIAKQSDLGLRSKRNAAGTAAENVTSPIEPKPAPTHSKKRAAPSSSAVKKKGTATAKKPASKKRKLDPDADPNTRSVTPTSRPAKSKGPKKGSQAGTPAADSSPAPDHSSQIYPSDDDAESSDDHTLYCICKKPDNHKWMIGCDGGCDDWFHGDCVDMKQTDEDLVDKFICPNCEQAGKGQTTWKPMCRRAACRLPAAVGTGKQSKYCSESCGRMFFEEQLARTAGFKSMNSNKKRTKKKAAKDVDEADRYSDSECEDDPTPLGGVLNAKDLKALVDASPNIQAFKNLGSGVLSPPRTASPTCNSFDSNSNLPNGTTAPAAPEGLSLTAGETERLNALHKEKSQLKDRLEVLKDREKFVSMAKEQATRVAEREKIKPKDFCGYDSRLSWSDPEFLHWRHTTSGIAAFKFSTLSPSDEQLASLAPLTDNSTTNGTGTSTSDPTPRESVCLKKRCSKHAAWQKLNLQDARFEELEVVEAMKECEKEEKSVRERAALRGAREKMAREIEEGVREGEGRGRRTGEGWVEVCE